MRASRKFILSMTTIAWLCSCAATTAVASSNKDDQEINQITLLLEDKKRELTYPSIAGEHLVLTARSHDGGDVFSVLQTSSQQPDLQNSIQVPTVIRGEDIRFGVATTAGIGYSSSRMGPVSAWLWSKQGDLHISLGGYLTYRGALIPNHLNASLDGRYWCFDSSMEKMRHNEMLQEFDQSKHEELRGQMWRVYDSNFFRRKDGYRDNATGTKNRFDAPVLFVFDRQRAQLAMIPNAFNGAISPDGQKIAFVREDHGNYDLWMQNMDGTGLTQLTHTDQGEYEPTFSPDGSKLAFTSNRDSDGNVRHTSIYMMELSSGKTLRLTASAKASDGGAAWKDNHHIVFHSNRSDKPGRTSGGWRIWQVEF